MSDQTVPARLLALVQKHRKAFNEEYVDDFGHSKLDDCLTELEALLRDAAPQPCKTCLGRGWITRSESRDYGNGVGAGGAWNEPCPDCKSVAAQTAGAPDAIAIVEKHRREIERSPGVGWKAFDYGLTVCDDILNDLRALPDGTEPPDTPMHRLKGSLRGEETDQAFDQAVREIRDGTEPRVLAEQITLDDRYLHHLREAAAGWAFEDVDAEPAGPRRACIVMSRNVMCLVDEVLGLRMTEPRAVASPRAEPPQ